MEKVFAFVEKLVALVTSQRFITTLVGLIVAGVVMFNLVMPLFQTNFDEVDVPDSEMLTAQLTAWIAQAAAAVTFFLGLFRMLATLVQSIENEPPQLSRDYAALRANRTTTLSSASAPLEGTLRGTYGEPRG
jgi:TRAP-type C4-dicarboxylate transport system permease small subunit